MKALIDRIFFVVIILLVIVLAGTALPTRFGGHLEGTLLLIHMGASGAMVFALPLMALWFLTRSISSRKSGGLQRLGFWLTVACGTVTIATMFVCMLPLPSTEQMHQLFQIHAYAGFAMVPAVAVLVLGWRRWRRIQSTRSATLG